MRNFLAAALLAISFGQPLRAAEPALGTYHWPNGPAGVEAFAVPEGLDHPTLIERMHAFITDPANNVAFHCYFDINEAEHGHQLSPGVPGTGKKEGTEFPRSAAKFRELFSAKKAGAQ